MKPKITTSLALLFGLIIGILFPLFCQGQMPFYKHFTTSDGLPSSEVHQILQSKSGHIWLATDRGISKFDGFTFENYTTEEGLADNAVFYITEDHRERLWYFTINNELGYLKDGQLYEHPLNDTLRKMDFFFLFNDMYVDSHDTIWLGLKKANNLENITVLKISPDNKILPIRHKFEKGVNVSNTIWVEENECVSGFVCINSTSRVTNFLVTKENQTVLDTLLSLDEDYGICHSNANVLHDNELIISADKYFIRFNKKAELFKTEDGLTCNKVIKDHSGDLWMPSFSNGLKKLKTTPNQLHSRAISSYFDGLAVSCIFRDKEGGVWVTTLSNGMYYFPDFSMVSITQSPLIESFVIALAEEKDTVWAGMKNGTILKMIQSDESLDITMEEKYFSNLFCLDKFENMPLVIGAAINRDLKKTPFQRNHILGGFRAVLQEEKDLFFFYGSAKGKLHPDSGIVEKCRYKSLKPIATFKDSKGRIWVGGLDGLVELNGCEADYPGERIPELNDRINSIDEWQGKLALGSMNNGVLLYDGEFVQVINKELGLSSNLVHTLKSASDTVLWVGTNNGLNKIISHNGQLEIKIFDKSNGIPSNKINDLIMNKNHLWVGSDQGVSILDLDKDYTNAIPPSLYLNSITVNGEQYHPDSIPEFNYKSNSFLLDFKALSYKLPSKNLYRYRIKEIDTNWIYTPNTNIQLSILSPGEYTVEIMGTNNNGIWSDITPLNFVIVPPFWKTTWFIVLFCLGVLAIAYILIQSRIDRINQEATTKEVQLKKDNTIKLAREQLEKEKLKNQLIQNEVDFKKREMVSYSIQLNKKNDLLHSMKDELDELKSKVDSSELKGMKKLIMENMNIDNDWESFQIHFNQVHPHFFEKLKSTYQELSSGELKYCAYFKIQLSNKEIARLLNVTPKAVHIAKYRIKKKLQLTKEDDLMEFLLKFE